MWHLDFSGPPTDSDGTTEDFRTSWGNTVGWNVMPGADTWSAKEYKGFIYAGDMGRGFDVYGFRRCEGAACVALPSTPGRASGGGQLDNDLALMTILRGTSAGGDASLGFNAEFVTGMPTGNLSFNDQTAGTKIKSTSVDFFTATGNTAHFEGKATVNGVPGFAFTVEVMDAGNPGTGDTFSILVPATGYTASGVLAKGNIEVRAGS